MNIKYLFLLIGKSSPCNGGKIVFLTLSKWSFVIYLQIKPAKKKKKTPKTNVVPPSFIYFVISQNCCLFTFFNQCDVVCVFFMS